MACQTTSKLLLIRPVRFAFNPETAQDNKFQVANEDVDTAERALEEFDAFSQLLRSNGIDLTIIQDTPDPWTPDSVFPNNWISFHEENNGTICLYPMFATVRRLERKQTALQQIEDKFQISKTLDFSTHEDKNEFLEGTGSLVLDRVKRIAYASISLRTDKRVVQDWCDKLRYTPVLFHAEDAHKSAIYHTNVVMCVGEDFVLICLDAIPSWEEREGVVRAIRNSGKTLVEISLGQMNNFAGNMLQVRNIKGERILIMSSQAYRSLNLEQIKMLESFNERILHAKLDVIEKNGGGSARCMLAEIFLKLK